jgi:WD40 repeat protein
MHPKQWGQHNNFIDLPDLPDKDSKSPDGRAYIRMRSALSPDKKLLAISSGRETILIYDLQTKELQQKLDGCEEVHFRPSAPQEESIVDVAEMTEGKPAYTLISSVSCNGEKELVIWDLDKHGRLLVEEERIDASAIAKKAIDAISGPLEHKHEWSRDFIDSSVLHEKFEKALSEVAATHRRRNNITLKDASLSAFGAVPFSPNGKYLLYIAKNNSPRNGMRDPDELPQVVVYDIDAGKEVNCLRGHTDYITWAEFSPSGDYVATISWDGTMRLYSIHGGSSLWATPHSGGQCWSGNWSADSKFIVWSSNNGQDVKVVSVVNGEDVSVLEEKYKYWCRCMVWHPDGQQIALCVGLSAYIWRPFDGGSNGTITQHFEIPNEGNAFMASIQTVKWLEDGKKLAILSNEGTNLVYDMETNSKEIFRRPRGTQAGWTEGGMYKITWGVQLHDYYISVDGDGVVRYWRPQMAEPPSWWDEETEKEAKEKEGNNATSWTRNVKKVGKEKSTKKPYPETGKYVNVILSKKSESKDDRDAWAQKGANLWTAE